MFKRKDEVEAFINYVERFINAVIAFRADAGSDTAAYLNKRRDSLQEFLNDACGLNNDVQDPAEEYTCPDCGSAMKQRTNRQNGNKFYGCVKYPECRGTRDENGLSRQEREERKYKTDINQQDGFSFNRKRDRVNEVGPSGER